MPSHGPLATTIREYCWGFEGLFQYPTQSLALLKESGKESTLRSLILPLGLEYLFPKSLSLVPT